MKTKDFNDGVCENCGNTGLAGEKCLTCGGILSKIEADDSDPLISEAKESEPEVYPLEVLDKEIAEGDIEDDPNLIKNDNTI